ncbi:Ditrans,polycis-undecaprenyl-diphosphate synthase ((2E,6E)-farnesyl-diphosphate specific) [Saliniradius amylolyticus]|uniref:Ditrans,polycis-undecaprenyl-diphosphate synthase ((2E,6E)-farnesyl-diphosphate specific) n=1 Tax=Saliniradius amylolyticus TaxID=2183582 RepID=A0A2S2E4M0_9ALTE|nr:polyprenyl diphosphate synthase [Saliniradius amylolyticus]AWL12608.1 Ditrans,polycis-undecaprenyl-diphosphate synthase ((2E,6E)-farnesyl-diphosphate specific) [Saliniradius amylolyticus]
MTSPNEQMPRHVAIIMDGNGRWARQRGKIRSFGHKAGVESVRAAVRVARQSGIEALTLFAFSSENWQRPDEEVGGLMQLFKMVLKSEVKKLHKNDVRLRVIGDLSRFDDDLVGRIRDSEALTADNRALTLNIAANYGGRWEITRAARQLALAVAAGKLKPEQIDEARFQQETCLAQLPELDLLIRTGGESRVSNFLLWQLAYAELYFTPALWPDFNEQEFELALADYAARQRRFGLTSEQLED